MVSWSLDTFFEPRCPENQCQGTKELGFDNSYPLLHCRLPSCLFLLQLDRICFVFQSLLAASSFQKAIFSSRTHAKQQTEYPPMNCSSRNKTDTCPTTDKPQIHVIDDSSGQACPEYFRWIHEDLRLWKEKGITKELVESGKSTADIRLVVVDGKLYLEKNRGVFQTRDVFTIWGLLQLLRFYPGKLPDLDLLFQCGDRPVIKKANFKGEDATKAPPLFHYCGNDETFDIAFPDWSFWGWPEIHIKPWEPLRRELEKGNKKTKWMKRESYAYWKGNPDVSATRGDLLKCNRKDKQDWGTQAYAVRWNQEARKGFKTTNLASQCTHRYKIYAEGIAWSVSQKYILACDSMSLHITPRFYDFFTRSLVPTEHYWPIKRDHMCKSIKFAVDWGNKHTKKAQKIGKAGSNFVLEGLKMKNVYDYMFHLLTEYAKLLKYKPTIPPGAVQVCLEAMACDVTGVEKVFKIASMVRRPADIGPCTMPPPYQPEELNSFLERKANLTKQVELWEASGTVGEF
ncbi:hypothetical protein RJ639_039300 [Escallonia herrerae]|uniref:Glycosyl transferase CAP10 domain-containing protein n=1 Tax=Escallonia herrerae TaxID=1293975 RepID=A0AA89B607_9ASTE|nr:hypothetical protein RJ639_039300 [Escallonia herrerae]